MSAMTAAGATIIDLDAAGFVFPPANNETLVLCFDFRNDVQSYFATRVGVPVAHGTLTDAIAFNNAHSDEEIPYFNQDLFEFCNALLPGPDDPQPAFGGVDVYKRQDVDTAAAAVKSFVKSGDVVLLKASRTTRLERIGEVLRAGEAGRRN